LPTSTGGKFIRGQSVRGFAQGKEFPQGRVFRAQQKKKKSQNSMDLVNNREQAQQGGLHEQRVPGENPKNDIWQNASKGDNRKETGTKNYCRRKFRDREGGENHYRGGGPV